MARISQALTGMPATVTPAFLVSLPRSSRRTLYAAVFFMFSSVGFLADILRPRIDPAGQAVLIAAGTGATAVAYVYVLAFHTRWFAAFTIAHVVFTLAVAFSGLLGTGIPMADAGIDAIRAKLMVDAIGCLLAFMLSYTFFMMFIGYEGRRYARAHAEIELAGEIHRLLVPTIDWSDGRYVFYGVSRASTEVGGDLVDVVARDGGWIGYVADVSGHGVASGLLMGVSKSAIRTRAMSGGDLGDILNDVNRALGPLSKPNMYVTLAALHEDGSGALMFSVAGHPPILRFRRATRSVEELTLPQIPLAMFDDRTFTSARVRAEPGDLLAIVTDGLTEVFNAHDEEFGLERIKQLLAAGADQPLDALAGDIMRAAGAHGPQADDQTLLLVRMTA